MYVTLSGKSVNKELFSTARKFKTSLEKTIKAGVEVSYNPLSQKFADNKWLLSVAVYGRVFERINHPTSLKLYLIDYWSKLDKKNCSVEYKNSIKFAKELDYVANYIFLNYYPYANKKVAEPNKQLKYIEQRKEELQDWMRTAKPSWLIEPIRKLANRISKELGFSLETLYKPEYKILWNRNYKGVKVEIEQEYEHDQDPISIPTIWKYKEEIDQVKLIQRKQGIQPKPVNPVYFFTSLRRAGKHLGLNRNLKKEVLNVFGLWDVEKKYPTEQALISGRAKIFKHEVKPKRYPPFTISVIKWLVEDLLDNEYTYPPGVLSNV